MKKHRPVLAVDFDGVAAQYNGWKGEDHLGRPMPGLERFLEEVIKQGWNIILHSCRPAWRLQKWAEQYGLARYFVGYNENPYFNNHPQEKSCKPVATMYLDDRAVRFHGDWNEVLAIMNIAEHVKDKRIYELEFERDVWKQKYKQLKAQQGEQNE